MPGARTRTIRQVRKFFGKIHIRYTNNDQKPYRRYYPTETKLFL